MTPMENDSIIVEGAREHNLKNINVRIPRRSLTVVTGLSGSGKSSLAFDTIYAEGQRRYIETFSAYARNFLGGVSRPDVDKISGLSPVISIEQKTTNKNPRSTVGTTTEIYDFLRLLYARAGEAFSYETGERMVRYTDEQIVDLLLSKKVRIVCLGDGMHSESRGRERWILSYLKYVDGIIDSAEMMEEMGENLSTMMSVMTLKTLFPENFHFLKGNHENITNRMGDGDYPFCKFAEESTMTHDFMMKEYGGAIVSAFGEFEDNLPLAAVFPHCVLSHAEPSRTFSRDELINARLLDGVVGGLTWTANGDAEEGSVEGTMKNLLKTADAVYIGGHRVVSGKYALRQGGKYIQIHNPHEQNIALVMPNRAFNVDSDIISVF